MGMETVLGISLVIVGGLIIGAGAWPMKLMRTFQFEHWWFLAMLVGLVVGPWTITLVAFPTFFDVLREPEVQKGLLIANALALCWGVANILCGLCYVRIGIALTQAILTGLGVSVGVLTPMIFKGSGAFKSAPGVLSPTGLTILGGVAVMLIAVVLASLAGFGRDRQLKKLQQTSGSFLGGLIMTVIAGIASAGLWLAFIYCQGPIQSRVSIVHAGEKIDVNVAADEALCQKFRIGEGGKIVLNSGKEVKPAGTTDKEKDAASKKIAKVLSGRYLVSADGSISLNDAEKNPVAIDGIEPVKVARLSAHEAADRVAAAIGLYQGPTEEKKVSVGTMDVLTILPVWAAGAFSGAMLNLLYPMFLMTKRRSWGVFLTSWKEVGFSLIMGIQLWLALILPGKGMVLLGALGASIGVGIQQAMQMVGGQGTGFISGEWRGVHGRPRWQMYASIALLIIASLIMAYSNTIKQ